MDEMKKGHQWLVLDDDPAEREIILQCCRRVRPEVSVHLVGTGQELIGVMEKDPGIDLILMDLQMPDMDGFEVLQNLSKKKLLRGETRVILFSNTERPDDRQKALQMGATQFSLKPGDIKEYKDFLSHL